MAHGRRLLGLWRWDTSLVHSAPTREEALTHAFTPISGLGCTRARTRLARKHDSVRYPGLAPLRRLRHTHITAFSPPSSPFTPSGAFLGDHVTGRE